MPKTSKANEDILEISNNVEKMFAGKTPKRPNRSMFGSGRKMPETCQKHAGNKPVEMAEGLLHAEQGKKPLLARKGSAGAKMIKHPPERV